MKLYRVEAVHKDYDAYEEIYVFANDEKQAHKLAIEYSKIEDETNYYKDCDCFLPVGGGYVSNFVKVRITEIQQPKNPEVLTGLWVKG
ncbi:hypothetical protein GYW75_03080 [Gilliamella sp. ESL0232]|uniref:hypothetical protein n=1 Tax=unclassified Gilliamella TaxID=2685620 RepID=UPI00158034CC|nr:MULTISPECIES: hypothetical protein [unclassified Gilliamella]MCO6546123.1 hypothetical protein [Gilliamella sp.]MCO6555048.1 hypothetical protein [Gilliamella sp.]NUE95370.1 hypothetical protein [Gilliamella sp. ESL0232]